MLALPTRSTVPSRDYLSTQTASLFASGEQGVWYDPSDMSTLFQDTAGAVPVTAVEQPVGRMLDKSGRGNHATQATTTKRPIYSRRVNLLLDSTTLATQSITTLAAAHRLVFSGSGSVTLSGTAAGVYGAGVHSITCTAGTLLLTVSGAVQDASFHLLIDSHLVYQGINTATDYDAGPTKFPAYLRFDGVDDALQTGNIDFTGTDKMTVWAGAVKSDAAGGTQYVAYSNGDALNGFAVYASSNRWAGYSSGTTSYASAGDPLSIANTQNSVISVSADQIAPYVRFRRDYQQVGASTAAQGGGGYGNRPLYIGSRVGTSIYFNGRLYSLIVRGAQSSLSQFETAEVHIKQKAKLP